MSGTASLDRKDSKIGYTKNNCQWVHKTINLCKHILSNEEFISMCSDVTKHNQLNSYPKWDQNSLYAYQKTNKSRKIAFKSG